MRSEVFLVRCTMADGIPALQECVEVLLKESGCLDVVETKALVAVKVHFGEAGQKTFVPPALVKPVVDGVKSRGGLPFLTDTNTLYTGRRSNSVLHIELAHEHGFSLESTGAPVIIADGLQGDAEVEVEVNGRYYGRVGIAEGAARADVLVSVTHVTGHPGTGMGGVLKNLGMGLSSRKGKLAQHSRSKPRVDESACTGCGRCIPMCPAEAIGFTAEGRARIDDNVCIGCGECLAVCRFGAVKFSWDQASEDLQRRIVEHAMGVLNTKRGRHAHVVFLINMTKGCDCFGKPMEPLISDVGIAAGRDPVALDAAVLDLARAEDGRMLAEAAWGGVDPRVQVEYADAIGLGSADYELVEVTVSS